MQARRVVAALRRPEYTGENRCLPCTVLNLVLVAAASVAVAAVATPTVGVFAAVAGIGLVYARGYVLPGTPTLTQRYLPASVTAHFEHGEIEGRLDSTSTGADLDPESALVTAGALQTCADRDDLCLDPLFRSDWRSEMVATEQNVDAAADRLLPPEFDESAAVESGESPAPRELRQSVYVTLHQNHLPKLDSLGIVKYDDVSKIIELDDGAHELDVYLEIIESGHLSWSEYYLGVVVLGLVATLASHTGTPLLAALDPLAYATGALVTLLGSIGFQIRKHGSPWLDRLTGS